MIQNLMTAMDCVLLTMERVERKGCPVDPATPPPGTPLDHIQPPSGSGGIRLSLPGAYDGAAAGCQGFLLQLELYLAAVQPPPSGRARVSALISCLTGKALEWANAIWEVEDPTQDNYEDFSRRIRAVFDHPPEGRAAGERLFHLRQEMRSAREFALDFRTLAAGAGWNERALIDHYRCGLREDVRRELACRDTTLHLDQLVDLSIQLDNLLASRGRPDRGPLVPSSSPLDPTPMELGGAGTRETGGETVPCTRGDRRGHTAGRCWGGFPGSRGGRRNTGGSSQVSRHTTHPDPPVAHMWLSIRFSGFSLHSQHKALVDSGAAGNFIDRSLANRLGIPIVPVDVPFPIHALDSRPLGSGLIREVTVPITMVTQESHEESISLFLIDAPEFPVVLGLPWLASHDPIISWQQRVLKGWSCQCSGRCLGVSLGATTVESPNQVSTVHIPPEYADLAIAFCKRKATQLPPHRPGDCAINLLEGAALPRSHVYPLSQEETAAMETYVAESLGQGYIRPSISPVSSSFFFVKKDGGLRPCIDYRGLNQITVKYSYPLPLIASMTESLLGACFFTKLDLRSAYNLVRIRGGDEWKA
uniref:Retrotransposon gag domain-containing protein n=1 Tax=Salmo trutta TaxID=8032 RepID=A0A674B569_SALTR